MLIKNLALATIVTAPSPDTSGTSLVVDSGQGARFPTPSTDGYFYATAFPADEVPHIGNAEVVRVTAKSTDTFTIVRAQRGTTAKAIEAGWLIMQGVYVEDILLGNSGWQELPFTLTYASPTSMTVSGVDVTAIMRKGTYIRISQSTGGTKYFVVASSSFSTNTTINIIPTTDYTLNNEAINSPHISYIANPDGWPGWFNFQYGSITASGSMTVSAVGYSNCRWKVIGNIIYIFSRISITLGGTPSNQVNLTGAPVLPDISASAFAGAGTWLGENIATKAFITPTGDIAMSRYDNGNFATGTGKGPFFNAFYQF